MIRRGSLILLFAMPTAACNKSNIETPIPADVVTRSELSALQERISLLEMATDDDETLKLSDTGFSAIRTAIGTITAQMISVKPRGSGSLITLRIGNPTSATITELTIVGHWGSLTPKGEQVQAASGKLTIDGRIPPASWSTQTITIDGVPPDKLGYFTITYANAANIQLYTQ